MCYIFKQHTFKITWFGEAERYETSMSGIGKLYRILYLRVEPWKPIAEQEGNNENETPMLVQD